MHITKKRTEIILNYLRDKHDVEECGHYGEPGYQDPEAGILFANWNKVSKRLREYLEETGYELEWSDEWIVDYEWDKAYRTSPDSYQWQCQIHVTDDGEMLTPDDSYSSWIEEFQVTYHEGVGGEVKALPGHICPEDHGWIKFNSEAYESGWHSGQTDDPQEIASVLFERRIADAVLFQLNEVSQFYVKFDVFYLPFEE